MAKLRHLAILTHQPDKLADFYKRVFDMKEQYRTKNGSVHLSVFVFKNPQPADFFSAIFSVGFLVTITNAQQHQ